MSTEGRFTVNEPTRHYFGDPLIKFVEKNMLTREGVVLSSRVDCATPDSKAGLTRIFGAAATDDRKEEFCNAVEQASKVGPLNVRTAYKDDTTSNAILFPTTIEKTMDMVSGMDGFAPEISKKDANAFFLMHEVHHENVYAANPTVDSVKNSDGFEEFQSDMAARKAYGQALKENVVTDPSVPDAVRGGRALLAMQTPSKYDGASLAGVPGVSINDKNEFAQAMEGVHKVREKTYREIGKDLISADDITREKYYALKETLEAAPAGTIDQATLNRFKNEPDNNDALAAHARDALRDVPVPDSLKETVAEKEKIYLESATTRAGVMAAATQPELTYQAARRLELKGEFNDNAYSKAFAREYVRAAETYAPDLYKTDGQKTYSQNAPAAASSYAPIPSASNNAQMQMSF